MFNYQYVLIDSVAVAGIEPDRLIKILQGAISDGCVIRMTDVAALDIRAFLENIDWVATQYIDGNLDIEAWYLRNQDTISRYDAMAGNKRFWRSATQEYTQDTGTLRKAFAGLPLYEEEFQMLGLIAVAAVRRNDWLPGRPEIPSFTFPQEVLDALGLDSTADRSAVLEAGTRLGKMDIVHAANEAPNGYVQNMCKQHACHFYVSHTGDICEVDNS